MLKALIFDVDGTLAETEEVHRRAFNAAFDEFGLGWDWDEALYRDLLRVAGGKERILHFIARIDNEPAQCRVLARIRSGRPLAAAVSGGRGRRHGRP